VAPINTVSSAEAGTTTASARSASETCAGVTVPCAWRPLSSRFASGMENTHKAAAASRDATATGMMAARMMVGSRRSSPRERSLATK
jgi:hypothetical protein